MRTWEEFIRNDRMIRDPQIEWEGTDITCPECSCRIYVNNMIVLTSNPPKRKYKCFNCEWVGTH